LEAGGRWIKFHYFFDDLPSSVLTLFHVATDVGWAEVMFRAGATNSEDQAPIRANRPYNYFILIFFMLFASFFILKLFMGVLISTYIKEKELLTKNYNLTDKQKEWQELKILMEQAKPKRII